MTHDKQPSSPFSSPGDPSSEQFEQGLDESLLHSSDVTSTPPAWNDFSQRQPAGDDERPHSDKVASKVQEKVVDAQQKASDMTEGVGEKASQVAGQVQDKAQELTDNAHTMSDKGIDSAAAGLGQAASMLRQQGESREGTVGAAAAKTADTLDSASSYLREKDTDQLMADLEALVRRRPVESVLVAAGVGFVLSKLLG